MSMRLYSFFRSSAAFRVRIALNLKGIEYETVRVTLSQGEHREAPFLAKNPLAAVPVLEHDGEHIQQSLAIIEYLDSLFSDPRLLPPEPLLRARVQAFAQTIACEVHPLNNLRVLRYLRRELEADEPTVQRWYSHWIAESFRGLETIAAHFSAGSYCFGDAVSLADVCLIPQIYNARRFSCDLTPYPTLVRIADALRETPAFFAAAPEQQPDAE